MASEHFFILGIFEGFHTQMIMNWMKIFFLVNTLSTTKHLTSRKKQKIN